MTNEAGYYSITLPRGQYQIEYRMMGMKTTRRNVIVYSNGILDVGMDDDENLMEAVIVTATRDNIKDVRTGTELINVKMLRQIPMGLGEADIIKSSLLLPGVQTVGEASAGFNVRGGSTDQNLVLLDYAPVINTSHMFGFFSAFNPDLVTDVTLYKSGMPAKYGGRLSSVMVINPSAGNREKINVSGGISPVTGRILVEGPVSDEKTSFIIGARSTYSDWLLGFVDDYRIRNSNAGFYDLQGSISHDFDKKNSISLSAYYSRDRFNYYLEKLIQVRESCLNTEMGSCFQPGSFCQVLRNIE
ncbi:MAG: TonB-dependent receptor [Bacteroidales bacterium]|nr:TonB-dependent receptor [Bacteroidales bacterium]